MKDHVYKLIDRGRLMKNPERRAYSIDNGHKLGLNPETSTTFDWLEADERELQAQVRVKFFAFRQTTSNPNEPTEKEIYESIHHQTGEKT